MLLLTWLACATPSPVGPVALDVDPPAGPGARAPALLAEGDRIWASWLERREDTELLQVASFGERGWGAPTTVAAGPDLLASWADVPRLARGGDGALVVTFPVERAGGYDLHLARSVDDGATWRRLGPVHRDGTAAEHGFASLVPSEAGLDLLWLDGRATADGGPTALYRVTVGEALGAEELVDERVCDCCSTDAGRVDGSLVVAYRDRGEEELRDVTVARRRPSGWTAAPVAGDGWQVAGCPVNGPALEARPDALAVAWYTAAPAPEVRLSFSFDGGASFDPPYVVDGSTSRATPLGRIDLASLPSGEVVTSWLHTDGDQAVIQLRRFSPDGRAGAPYDVAHTDSSNTAGAPSLSVRGEELVVAWTEVGPPSRVRARRIPIALVLPAREQASRATTTSVAVPLPDRLPEITVSDAQGAPVPLAAPPGRPTLVNLWASWCGPCVAELPDLVALAAELGDAVRFVGLSVDDRPREAARVARAAGVGWPLRFTDGAAAREAFGSPQVPATYLFDGDGRLLWSIRGAVRRDDPGLAAALRHALERPRGPDADGPLEPVGASQSRP